MDIKKKSIPNLKDVLAVKKSKIKHDIDTIVNDGQTNDYNDIAKEIVGDGDPYSIISALLKYIYADDLADSNYKEVNDASSVDREGKTRLFVAFGKIERLTPSTLVERISHDGGVPTHAIQEVKLYYKYSFITVPFAEAEKIIEAYKNGDSRRRHPLVERAKG